jgi:hypothetical protein
MPANSFETPPHRGDLDRHDMAWAKHAAGLLRTLDQIRDELFDRLILSKKGIEYAEGTARKAIGQLARVQSRRSVSLASSMGIAHSAGGVSLR